MKYHTPFKSFVAFSIWTCLALASAVTNLSAQVTLSEDDHANSYLKQTRSFSISSGGSWVWESDSEWLTSDGEAATQTGNLHNEPINGQSEANYDNVLNNGTFAAGTGYLLGDTITLADGTTITTTAVDGSGAVTGFTVDSSTATVLTDAGNTLAQISTTGVGTGFSLAVEENNVDGGFPYTVEANTTGEERVGTLTFRNSVGGGTRTFRVTQLPSLGPNTLSLSQTERVTDFNAKTTLSVDVTSDTNWLWSSDANWLTTGEATNQTGNNPSFTYAVSANNTGAARTGTLTFTTAAGDVTTTLTVTQLSSIDVTLSLSETERVIGADADAALTVDVSSGTDWLWSSDSAWLTSALAQSQNGDQTFTYAVSDNDTGAPRTGILTFATATGGITATLTVTQLSRLGSTLNLSESVLITDFNAKTTLNVGVTSDTNWLWSSDANWLTTGEATTQTGNNPSFTYAVSANNTGAARTGTLTFTTETGDVSATLTVTQLSSTDATLSLSESLLITDAGAKPTLSVDVSSGTGWLWSSDSDWLTSALVQTQTGNRTFNYQITENTTGVDRTGILTFITSNGGVTATLTVTQLAGNGVLALDVSTNEENLLVPDADTLDVDVSSNGVWTWSSDSDWLTSTESSPQLENQTFSYDVSENTSTVTRTGTLTFETTTGGLIEVLTVTQAGALDTDGDGDPDVTDLDDDNDGLTDVAEINTYGTDPLSYDTDGDGYSDLVEILVNNTDPFDASDPDNSGGGAGNVAEHSYAEFLSEQDVSIPDGFTPFGNTLAVSKYGDDGSSAIADLSGVIIWADSVGNFRPIVDSELASPLYVTNNELIVWQNRYADFDSYDTRPAVEIVMYRLNSSGNPVATPLPAILGKEVIDTAQLTTSTGSFVLATSEVVNGDGFESITWDKDGVSVPEDLLTIRYYRVTASAGVQRITQYDDGVPRSANTDFGSVQQATDLKALAFGSDGSSLARHTTSLGFATPAIDKYLWVSSLGVVREVPATVVNRVVSVTNTRLVIESVAGAGLQVYRRMGSASELQGPFAINVQGAVLDWINLTRVGYPTYFYTRNETTIRTYRLTDTAILVRTAELPLFLSAGAKANSINLDDGSAIISDQNNSFLIWLHNGAGTLGDNVSLISNSGQAKPLYLTSDECILWDNAYAPVQLNGSREPAALSQRKRVGNVRTEIPLIEGTYVIDTPQFSLGFEYWTINTAEKVDALTANLRRYQLKLAPQPTDDTDGDGLTNGAEENTYGTNPFVVDSDGDGLTDGDEVNTYGTDPLSLDTDGDGVSDGAEVNDMGSDPLVDEFGGNEPSLVDFTNPAVWGAYYGLIIEEDGSSVGYLSLKVSKKGSFSGKLSGYTGLKSSFKGKFDALGQYTGQQFNAFGLSSNADFQLEVSAPNTYRLGGVLKGADDRKQYLILRKTIYSKSNPTADAGKYTMLMPSETTSLSSVPAGDGFAYGSVRTDGKVKLKGYSNAGNKITYSGVIVEGDLIPFFSLAKSKSGKESVTGMLQIADIPNVSDFSGSIRHSQTVANSGSAYAAGYDTSLSAIGSRYVGAGFALLPTTDFMATTNNAVASFAGGTFGGEDYVFTWESTGKMTAPKLPIYRTKAKFKNKDGYFNGRYDSFDPAANFVRTKADFRGVVIQKQGLVSGQSVVQGLSGRYSITPNDGGTSAPATTLTPRAKDVSSVAASYIVQVVVDTPWQVEIPGDATWVTTDVAEGTGNGQVTITVEENATGRDREAEVRIAGLVHKVEQEGR